MDIVITVPRKEIAAFEVELQELALDPKLAKYFKLSHIPKMANVGDAAFIVMDGRVSYKSEIKAFDSTDFICETFFRSWNGNFVACQNFEEFNGPAVIGFQGFRYAWWTEGDVDA